MDPSIKREFATEYIASIRHKCSNKCVDWVIEHNVVSWICNFISISMPFGYNDYNMNILSHMQMAVKVTNKEMKSYAESK